jgi:uncharacterized membrane protein
MTSPISGKIWNRKVLTVCTSLVVLTSLVLSASIVAAQNSGFVIGANPSALCANPGTDATSSISVSSQGGFAGTVDLSDNVSPIYSNGVTLSAIPSSVTLTSGQTVSFNMTMYTTASTPFHTYTITLTGVSGVIFAQTSVLLTVGSSCALGGVTVPTAIGSIGFDLILGAIIAGFVTVASALTVSVSRSRSHSKP